MPPGDLASADSSLWTSDVSHHGVVRVVVVDGGHAARFDDMNGDGREIALTVYGWEDGQWVAWAGQDDVDLPSVGGPATFGSSGSFNWVIGRDAPGSRLVVEWGGGPPRVVGTDAQGWWLAIISDDLEPDEGEDWTWPDPQVRVCEE